MPTDPKKRVVTVAFEIADPVKAAWLWEMFKQHRDDQVTERGTWAYHFANGDQIRECNHRDEALAWIDERIWGDTHFVEDVKDADLTLEVKRVLLRSLDAKDLAEWLAAEEEKRLAAAMAAPAPNQPDLPFKEDQP